MMQICCFVLFNRKECFNMSRSYSRFTPHSPSTYRPRYSRPVYPARPVRRMADPKQPVQPRRSYWLPIATMMAAVLFAASAVMPRSIFDAFAADGNAYTVNVESLAGAYSVTVTGGKSTGIDLPAESAEKTVNGNGTVTFTLSLDEDTDYTIDSTVPITDASFGSGAEAVTSIDANSSGMKNIDVSKCSNLQTLYLRDCPIADIDLSGLTSLNYVNLINTPFATAENAYHLTIDNPKGFSVSINPPKYTAGDDCIEFELNGLGEKSDVTLTMNDGSTVSLTGDKYSVPIKTLRKIYNEKKTIYICAVNKNRPNVTYLFDIFPEDLPDSSILLASSGSGTQPGEQDKTVSSSDQQGETNKPSDQQEETNKPSDNQGGTNTPSDNQGGTSDDDDDDQLPNAELAVDSGSKSIIKNAYIEKNDEIDYKNLKIVAKAPSAADKKAFFDAIKKKDKDFKDSDSNLMVYNIYLVDSKGKKVSVKGKSAVTVSIAYPSKEVSALSDIFEYKVYHQLDDKTVDTGIEAYSTENGIGFTTDSFSLFAVSCTRKEATYTDMVIADASKNIIKAARAHENAAFSIQDGTEYGGDEIMISAAAPSEEEKKEFLAAIKKADSKFDEKDKNLLVYKIDLRYITGDEAAKLANGRVDFTLAYPNDTVKKDYGKYNYTVYHQKADKSIDTKQVAVGVSDGIMVTTDGFSLFAVSSTLKTSGGNPATGESNVSANIAMLLALLSMVSFAAVYAKNKAEQY